MNDDNSFIIYEDDLEDYPPNPDEAVPDNPASFIGDDEFARHPTAHGAGAAPGRGNGAINGSASGGPSNRPGSKSAGYAGGRATSGGGGGLLAGHPSLPASQMQYREVIVDNNGVARQAGADSQEGKFITQFRQSAEQNLYLFAKGVLNRHFLTSYLHKPVCEFIQQRPPFRKLILMPREHAKTAICSGTLPAHVLIQPAETNIYFPGMAGRECRILMAGETETMAKKNLRVIRDGIFAGNTLFRALWPQCIWERPKAQASEWSANAIIIPRDNEWPDPSIRAVGVGGAITGARPNFMIKDDLISLAAANSELVMQEAIDWHIASRALLETYETETGNQSWEVSIGCLTEDVEVTMADGQRKLIKEVEAGDEVWSADVDGSLQKRFVTAVIPQGYSDTFEIKTTRTTVKATANHPFLISRNVKDLVWVRADELQKKDLIVAHKRLDTSDFMDTLDVEFLWFLGFMFGDGWANVKGKRGYVCFSAGVDETLNNRALLCLRRYVTKTKIYLAKGRYYRTDSKPGAETLMSLGLKGTAKTKRVPKWVYQCDTEHQIAFLRGFCDADGGRQSNEIWRVEISNEKLLRDLRHLATLCGVRTGIVSVRERLSQPPNSPKLIKAISYGASFNLATIKRKESHSRNNTGGQNVWRDTKMHNNLRFERVTDITKNNIQEPVWDLTVKGTPSFFANGLAVHNTRWAVFDLYSYIIDTDPSVELIDAHFHRIIEDGKILWHEKYTLDDIEQLRAEYGSLFFLLYMNTAADPSLTDFDLEQVRSFEIIDNKLLFNSDNRDFFMEEQKKRRNKAKHITQTIDEERVASLVPNLRGRRLNDAIDVMRNRQEYLEMKGVRFKGG